MIFKNVIKKIFFIFIVFLLGMIVKSKANEFNGVYTIKSAIDSNYVLDVTGDSFDDRANIEIWSNNNENNQKFYIQNIGNNYYIIQSYNSLKCLDVYGASKENGANVIQYSNNKGDNQKWIIKETSDGYYNIISKYSGLYLDIANGIMNNGTNILTWEYNGGKNQKFIIEKQVENTIEDGFYQIQSAINGNYVLDVTGNSSLDCASIELWQNNNQSNQKYKIQGIGNGYYNITCVNSNKNLDVYGALKENGTHVIQYSNNNGDNQKWQIKDAGNGYFYVISKCSGLYLDVEGNYISNGANIITWQHNGGKNQKFKFVKTVVDEGRNKTFKEAHPDIKVGIDVSKYQGVIDWDAVKKDGIDYAMIRVGFRGYGESGSLNEDTMFEQNVKGARAAGLDIGVYFFSQAKNYEEGIKEAEYTINLIKKFDITYPVAFDTENSSSPTHNGRADNISVQDRTDAAKGFCSTIENAGYKTLIYASASWLKENLDLTQLSQYKIWLAHYTGATQDDPLKRPSNYKGDYVMWQYTSNGTINGIKDDVDCDIYYYLKDK